MCRFSGKIGKVRLYTWYHQFFLKRNSVQTMEINRKCDEITMGEERARENMQEHIDLWHGVFKRVKVGRRPPARTFQGWPTPRAYKGQAWRALEKL
jgi:hypothetical protein